MRRIQPWHPLNSETKTTASSADSNLELRQNALEQFCTIYSQPLVNFLRVTKKLDFDDAEEVVQSFWSEHFFRNGDPSHFVVSRVLDEVRRKCELKDQLSLWRLFDAQALQPVLTGAPTLGYAKLAQQFGFRSPKAASNAMQTVARKFNRVFVEIIGDYLPAQESELTQEVVDAELHKLLSVLSRAGALKLNRLESQEDSWLKGYSVAMEHASVDTYDRIRSQAKLARKRKSHESPAAIPQEFYAATYLLAIVAADLFSGIRISTQQQSAIANRAATVRQSKWLDKASKELLSEYVNRFA